jgi:DNA-binding HxlR family transcriptional regulator
MPKKYKQFCGLARAFDILGERWTPLIVRELMFGGRRFSDLALGLPGVSASVLTERLKHLEDERIVTQRELPAPAGSSVYELTDDGRQLAEALVPVAKWGQRRLGPRKPRGEAFATRWIMLNLKTRFDPTRARGIRRRFELHVDGEIFQIRVGDGRLSMQQSLSPSEADIVIRVSLPVLLGIGTGEKGLDVALASGEIEISGDPAAALEFRELFLG